MNDGTKILLGGIKKMSYRIKNKWVVTFGAILVQIAIGALYAWSLFNQPLSKAYGWELSNVVTTYSISLAAFSLSTITSQFISFLDVWIFILEDSFGKRIF